MVWNSEYLEHLESNCEFVAAILYFIVVKFDLQVCVRYNRGVVVFEQTACLLQRAISATLGKQV